MQYLLGLYEKAMPAKLNWQEKFENTIKAGFNYLEISIDETDEKLARLDNKDEWAAILQASQAAGCPIKSMCLSAHRKFPLGSQNVQDEARSLEIMQKALEMASFLGIRIIQLAGYDVYYSESTENTRNTFSTNLVLATQMAASYGVTLGFETMETPFMDTVGKAMQHVSAVNSPYLQIYPDLGNLTNAAVKYEHDLYADIASGTGHIVAAHLKESKPGVYRELSFGRGHVDFESAARAFLRQGVRMFVGEFWHVGSPAWKSELKSAALFLRGAINKAAASLEH